MKQFSILLVLYLFTISRLSGADSDARVIGLLEDFSGYSMGLLGKGHVDDWRWNDADRERASQECRLEITAGDDSRQVLEIEIGKGLPFPRRSHRVVSFAPHFPPETDAIRLRVKVNSGIARLFLGGPTAYYANSDVFTAIHELNAENPPRWVTVEFSLNHPLWRNYRRSGFSTEAPRNYYNRWAQEPTSLYISEGTVGEVAIGRVELISRGEGQPFPEFDSDQIRIVKSIADFENGKLDQAFNLYMADGEVEWFEQSWKREKPLRFTPASLSIAETGLSGKKSLISVGPTAEEVHCTGIHTGGAEDANAIQLSIKKEAPGLRNTLLGAGPAEPLDVLIFVTPKGKLFPWDRFEPSDELRASRKGGFDYQFTYREICDRTDIDFAVYQARRFLAPGKWTTLTVPFADFTCVYGAGAYRERFLKHEEIGGGDVIAVAWINPWSRQGDRRSEVTIHLDEVAFARLPGAPAELRSYWQIPGREKIRLVPEGEGPRQIRHMLLRDEK